jgi:hypothetical protein
VPTYRRVIEDLVIFPKINAKMTYLPGVSLLMVHPISVTDEPPTRKGEAKEDPKTSILTTGPLHAPSWRRVELGTRAMVVPFAARSHLPEGS